MENVTQGLPESPARRATRVARVGARYGFGFVFGTRFLPRPRRGEPGRVGTRLRQALEELGPNFAELGRFLAARRDLLPPEVATELARVRVAAAPVPFAEARAIVERELGNALERLFLRFEEAPVRVGVFTQSHRAVLPGERPVLVVFSRPGVRRDLLAMRPVADLTRRRLGDRLPLDPVELISLFATSAAQRRDAYFAAQTARRLREMEGFAPRAPEVYRRHSSGRCVTFEAPRRPAPLPPEARREVSEALVRLALVEGLFFADLSPGRFAVDEAGELWVSDPTEALVVDPERLRGLAETLAAARRGDVDAAARALPLAGGFVPRDDAALRRELREALGSLGGPLWREHPLAEVRDHALDALRKGGVRMQDDVVRMLDALVAAEAFGGAGSEGYNATEVAAEAAGVLISRYRDPAYIASRVARGLAQPEAYADYPRQIHAILNELKDGEVEVRFRHGGLDELIGKVDILANRLVFAILIAALLLGSSILGIFAEGARLLGVSVFGLAGFILAFMLGVLLLVGIIRSGRL